VFFGRIAAVWIGFVLPWEHPSEQRSLAGVFGGSLVAAPLFLCTPIVRWWGGIFGNRGATSTYCVTNSHFLLTDSGRADTLELDRRTADVRLIFDNPPRSPKDQVPGVYRRRNQGRTSPLGR
jgi:hypothetical protein